MAEKKTAKKGAVKEAKPAKAVKEPKAVKTVKPAAKPIAKKDVYLEYFDFKKTDTLLDLACGDGAFLAEAAPKVKNAVGLDCSSEQLALAAEALKKTKKVTLIEGWLQDAHFDAASFDKISMRNAIRNLNNHEKGVLIHKASHWIKPGGIFVVEDIITSFALHRRDERHEMIEAEGQQYYGAKWTDMRDAFYHDLYHSNPSDLSLMMHHFLFTGFNVLKIIKHTSCVCTIIVQK
ncbi:cyclopropane fatty-acyl-phospholipid synthase-like methyltransferase [Elusimicrobium simillimum]|uniref:class I SAM-dependent methyltransferase n=1 Tax=Elusimicrobium simillimum TaxID=3143438 RepID=UPI003C700BFD